MYLDINDLKYGIHGEMLNVITRYAENAEQAISEAQSEVESYLTARYDIRAEFAKTGSQRSPLVIRLVRDVALYNCFKISNPVNMPEVRRDAYRDTIAFLKDVQAERASIDALTRRTGTTGTSSYVSFGGNRKRNNQM